MCSAAANNQGQVGWMKQGFLSPLQPTFFIFLLLFLCGCASVDPVVKVGLVGPFEGANRAIGYDVIYSARLAVREINAAGGIGGYRVALVALDDSSDAELARQAAASLAVDPAVVVVIGHWLTETTAVSLPIYAAANLPFIPAGEPPIGQFTPELLPPSFHAAYEAVTPFEETAGPFAGSTYDAFQLIWLAMRTAAARDEISRTAVATALAELSYTGMTGTIFVNPTQNP